MVMDGRRPAGIMGGDDPYADPRLAAVYRALAESPDTAYRGSVLPFRRTTAGATELAVPGFLMDAARGAVDLLAGPHTGQMSPEATQSIMGFAGSSAMQAPQPGLLAAIKAYHGSPHAFDRFDMSKIGTGEGAQAYGHGLYFAQNPAIAEHYRNAVKADRPLYVGGKPVERKDPLFYWGSQEATTPGHAQQTIEALDGQIQHMLERRAGKANDDAGWGDFNKWSDSDEQYLADLQRRRDLAAQVAPVGAEWGPEPPSSLYHVTLSPDEDDLLDWDAPLSQQPEKVRKALRDGGFTQYVDEMESGYLSELPEQARPLAQKMIYGDESMRTGPDAEKNWARLQRMAPDANHDAIHDIADWYASKTGASLYGDLAGYSDNGQLTATERLRAAGIPGLRYFDGSSHTKGSGTRNYVMFDDKLVNIDKVER